MSDPIEDYLDRLLASLHGPPRHVRRRLAEAEAHLLDCAADLQAQGWSEAQAREEAVRRMGPPSAAVSRVTLRLSADLRKRLTLAVLLIGGVAGVAIGVAGALGRAAMAIWGAKAIATPFPAGSYSSADCRRWMHGYPSARDCVAAMTADHADDFLRNAIAAAILGLLALALHVWLQRRWNGLHAGADLLAGAGLAALAGVALLAQGADAVLTTRAQGAAQPLSLALAALLATGYFAIRARTRYRLTT